MIRPSNVLFNEYGSLKLCDFGLAKKIIDLVQVENNAETGVNNANIKPCIDLLA